MRILIWTVFSGERCGPWASCFSNERSCPSQGADNCTIVTLHYWKLLKVQPNYEGHTPSQREDYYKKVKMYWHILKPSSPELLEKFYPNWHKAYWGEGDFFSFKLRANFFFKCGDNCKIVTTSKKNLSHNNS